MFIDLIKMDAEMLREPDFIEPNVALQPEDNLVGDMTLDHKRLFTLMTSTLKQSEELKLKARFSSSEVQKSLFEEFSLLKLKYDLLSDLFWFEVKLTHRDLHNKPSIGVRQGFKIVWNNSSPTPFDLLKNMFE